MTQLPPGQTPPTLFEQARTLIQDTVMSWGLPGAGLALALHYARMGRWGTAVLALVGTGLLLLLLRIVRKLEPRLDALAEWLVQQLETSIIRLWRLTGRFQGKYYQHLVYHLRDFRVQGLKTRGPFVLDLRKIFVSLRVSPQRADLVPSAMLPYRAIGSGLDIWDFLAIAPSQPAFRRLVVLGPPGSGKTTLLEHLTLTYAQNRHRYQQRQALSSHLLERKTPASKVPALTPVLLYLRHVSAAITAEPSPSLPLLIEQQELIRPLNPPTQWFEARLVAGRCLVMLDGLDEIADPHQRQQVSAWVEQQMQRYPKSCFIVTSRPFGYKAAPLDRVTSLEVQPFALGQMVAFIRNWYLQTEVMSRLGRDDPGVRAAAQNQADDLIDRIVATPALAAMAINPLLLTMIATVHRYRGALPGRRVELYAEICDVLLGRRQDAKGIADALTPIQKKAVLQVLALKAMQRNTREFKTVTACLLIRSALAKVAGAEADPEQFLQHIENRSGLLVQREEGVYEFVHKSIQEYLAAVHIKELNREFILVRAIDDSWWDETIRLYAAQSDASYLIQTALERNSVGALTLAYDCWQEGLRVEPIIRQQLEAVLEQGLESGDRAIFQLAAEVKLARRLKNLLRIDDTTEIDTSLITCAEYQLFIDEKQLEGDRCQPTHWTGDRFHPGDANRPITGMRVRDAATFCDWLTQRTNRLGDTFLERYAPLEHDAPVFVGDIKCRLPTPAEAKDYPLPDSQLSIWCMPPQPVAIARHSPDDISGFVGLKGIRIVRERIQPLAMIPSG